MGWFMSRDQNWLLRTVNRSGAVSPLIRPTASRIPVMIPAFAARTGTKVITFHLGAPTAVAPRWRSHRIKKRRAESPETGLEQSQQDPAEPEQSDQHREEGHREVEAIDPQPAGVNAHDCRRSAHVFWPSILLSRSNSILENARTTKVIRKRIRPSSISAEP